MARQAWQQEAERLGKRRPPRGRRTRCSIHPTSVVGPLALLLFAPVLLLIAAFGGLPEAIGTSAGPAAVAEIPPDHLAVMQRVSLPTGIPWQILAAISKVESGFGANMGPSSAGAVGRRSWV